MDNSDESTSAPAPVHGAAGRAIGWCAAAVFAACILIALLTRPDGVTQSRDEGAAALSVWAVLLPNAAGIALALALPAVPPRKPLLPVGVRDEGRLRASVWALLAIAVAFPVVTALPGVSESLLYVGLKVALLIIGGAFVVRRFRPAVTFDHPVAAWRHWMPLPVIAVWLGLAFLAPWVPQHTFSDFDPLEVAIAGLLTALTAGVGEELFYRRWLQTRLEAWLSGWPGLLLTSLIFAFMHLGSHGTGDLPRDVVSVVVSQGTAGLLLGVVWWRFRALWAIIAIHILMNGWPVIAWFATG